VNGCTSFPKLISLLVLVLRLVWNRGIKNTKMIGSAEKGLEEIGKIENRKTQESQ
jgi:hypothetical protein